jgi:predicted PurR-regulated permease PerM
VSDQRRRRYALLGLLVGIAAVAAVVLWAVVGTVFFAVTVAYVLSPVRNRLVRRGFSRKMAAAVVAAGTFGVVLGTVLAGGFALYRRREELMSLLGEIPDAVTLAAGGVSYTVPTSVLLDPARAFLAGLAVDLAAAAPVAALKLFLFAVLLFGLLLDPGAAGRAILGVVPPTYHDIAFAYDERVRQTLYGIYVLQAATAFATTVVALVVFVGLGYRAAFTLAVVAGLLQFVPVVGPSVLLVVLAAVDVVNGQTTRAIVVLVVGGALIGAAPDAVIRPRLASYAAHLPTSLYFIGFVGGVLTVGAIGFIAGPLAVALVVETVVLLSEAAPGSGVPDGEA